MSKKNTAAASLLLATAVALSACGGNNDGNNAAPSGSSAASGNPAPSGSGSAAPSGKMEEITVTFPMISTVIPQMPAIEAAINKISQAKINTTVKLKAISSGEWVQQTNLMFTSNETMDLMYVSGGLYSSMVAKNQLVALDELLGQYGEGVKAAVGEDYINVPKIKGAIYAVPSVRDLASSYGVIMRKDLIDKYNIDVDAIKTLDDFAAALKTVKAGEPDFAPLVPPGVNMSFLDGYMTYDNLGDSLGVLPNYDNGLKVVDLYESQEYKELVTKFRQWYQDGYVLKDASTNKTSTFELLRSGKGFAYFAAIKPGIAEQEGKAAGTEVVAKELTPVIARTGTVTGAMWGIPVNSKHRESAMKFLNLMYADKDIVNLLDWGIEGEHYAKVDGQDGVIKYPEGVNAANTTYNMPLGWMFGNQFLSYTMEGGDADIWNKMDAFNKSAQHSKAMGFAFDATPVKTEFAAVSNVVTQYKLPLETGSVDPEKVLPEFIAKLKSAGIDKIVAEKQKQLDEWAKANPTP
ncbi:ABC transporter substrate-binding protein [Cohnella hashimotonis]|uniref:ABC transporter substrate-binding protein n=1 Tax=Cohnella hashimotonis TaxID=2826895 RepID=A0ABT6TQY4_9BACL|nr:ABC transporter substrate-binding protein [Cohnella hashimotonis]MDI4648946.1 ABC transporter substrate-binding protein [Cohnella hashimotonis]